MTEQNGGVERLQALVSAMRAAEDLPELLEVSGEAALRELSADAAYIGRIDHRNGRIDVVRRVGTLAEVDVWNGSASFPLAAQVRAQVVSEKAQYWSGTVNDPYLLPYDRGVLSRLQHGSAASFPVVLGDVLWGALYVTRRSTEPFGLDTLTLGALLGELLAAGVGRVEYHRQLRTLAYTDPLTELANRRAIDEQLLAWIGDPQAAPRLTVILCDVNRLKAVNDEHGHSSGDRLLREVGMLVATSASRFPHAVAGRIGGDEFVLVVPDAHLADIEDELTRLLSRAAALPVGHGLSIGVATRSELTRLELQPADQVRALLRLADAEQYRHKIAQHSDYLPRPRIPDAPRPTRDGRKVAAEIARLLDGMRADPGNIGVRLARVAATVCEAFGGAAWWVSEAVGDTIVDRYCGSPRDEAARDGQWSPTELNPRGYPLAEYPATKEALQGLSFFVDSLTGDDSERRFLIQTGFRSLIAAGGSGPDGSRWLVEVFGDALTPDLHAAEALLLALMSYALQLEPAAVPSL